ncbi:hypothetical protein PY365_11525 [Roseiarcaceae bacterium H3SJ34-1]|nr:hypothetical protein [Roseiarcaceae bacterium H3SJ34-1]
MGYFLRRLEGTRQRIVLCECKVHVMRPMTRAATAFDQAMAIEKRMNGAFGGDPDTPVQPPDQECANLARAPMWLLGLKPRTAPI